MSPASRSGRGAFLAAFVFLFCAYAATTSRELPWGDAGPMFRVAERLVARGEVSTDMPWPPSAPATGRGGRFYALNPLVPSLIHIPGVLIRNAAVQIAPATGPYVRAMACHVGPAAMGALACLFLYLIALELGVSRRAAALIALLTAFGSPVWVYARSPYSEVSQIACFTGALLYLMRLVRDPSARHALLFGLWAGLTVNTKIVYATSIVGAGLFLLYARPLRDGPARIAFVKMAGWVALGLLPGLLMFLGYNQIRWGKALSSGYPISALAEGSWSAGLWGMFLSPGKSLFLYAPPLLLSLWAVPRLLRRAPLYVLGMTAMVLPPLLLSAAVVCWSGDYAWGPRYAMFAVPAFLAPGALVLDQLLNWRARAVVVSVAVIGAFVQVLGSAFYWDHFIRLARDVSLQWLGTPHKTCPPPAPAGQCDSCFEDMHGLQWLPPFQPIVGHLWLARHELAGDDEKTTMADAPWRRYTPMTFQVENSFARARFDWWLLEFGEGRKAIGTALLLLLLGTSGVTGVWSWRRLAREG
jgi:hypothetical protein